MLHKSNVGLDQPRLALVVTQTGAGIECPDVFQSFLNGFRGTADRARNFLVLLVLQGAQMLIYDRDRIGKHLRSGFTVAVLVGGQLLLVVAPLIEQTIAQVAAGDSGRIHLAHQVESFMEIFQVEAGLKRGLNRLSPGTRIWRRHAWSWGRNRRRNRRRSRFWGRRKRSSDRACGRLETRTVRVGQVVRFGK